MPDQGDVLAESAFGTDLELVWIPGGSFQMGSPDGEGYDYERPQHPVALPGFWLGRFPVTQDQWVAVMGENPSCFTGSGSLPVESVSWDECREFLRRLSEAAGRAYRLPSEAEWEYACRGGSTTRYPWGDSESALGAHAWFEGNSREKPHPVGEKRPNARGLHDMLGSVWEWCEDTYHASYEGAPSDGSPRTEPPGSDRALRGGSWDAYPSLCRPAARSNIFSASRGGDIGFRVALSG